jgi:hypothetical protein
MKDRINRALMRRIHDLINQAESLPPVKRYCVTLSHPEHGVIKINRLASTAAEAEKAAAKLASDFSVVESREVK